jgi:hypothetical protein
MSTLAACFATVFAGWAAWETHQSVAETAKATRASVGMQAIAEYAAPEMLVSMVYLRTWQQQHPTDFAAQLMKMWLNKQRTASEEIAVRELDAHRRRVAKFYYNLCALAESGIIDEEFLSTAWYSGNYTFVADVLVPLQRAKDDALLKEGSITEDDRLVARAEDERVLRFYKRLADRSKLAAMKQLGTNQP